MTLRGELFRPECKNKMKNTKPISSKSVRSFGIGFGVFFAMAIFVLVALSGYFVASQVLTSEKEHWRIDLERRLDFQEQELVHLKDTALLFSKNSYITNGIVDVAGRGSYLPRELENMTNARELSHVGVVDFSGKPIALSPDFPQAKIDNDLLRYVIETGRERLWCDADGGQIFGAVPINYYNTPQGALIVVSKIVGTNFAAQSEHLNSGELSVMCGDRTIMKEGGSTGGRRIISLAVEADKNRHPLSHMLGLKLQGDVVMFAVLRPSFYLVLRLSILGLAFMIIGGYIARFFERELISARDGAMEASRARSQFLANMSHEIRTPLNGVIGNINLLLEEHLTPDQRALANDAKLSGHNLLELLNEILDFSKIDAGFMRLEKSNIELRKLVHIVEHTYLGAIHEKGLSISVAIEDGVPGEFVGDSLRIRQILNNFVSNAMKFTSSGSIKLDVRFNRETKSLIFSVVDTGIGILNEQLQKLFTPFSQAEDSTTRRFGGTGLGLSICRQLAHLMGGEVYADSEVGVGSAFFLKIPYEETSGDGGSWHTDSADSPPFAIAPLRVLVVEDNPVNASLLKKILSKYGHAIDVAANGADGVEAALSKKFDLILMDCQMPIMDGYDAARKIVKALGAQRPLIVALTANSFKEDREKCLEAGMDDFITKPVAREALEKIMRSVSDRSLKRES